MRHKPYGSPSILLFVIPFFGIWGMWKLVKLPFKVVFGLLNWLERVAPSRPMKDGRYI